MAALNPQIHGHAENAHRAVLNRATRPNRTRQQRLVVRLARAHTGECAG
jgi:hypothetical protein